MEINLDINAVLAELQNNISDLTLKNAILKAQINALQRQLEKEKEAVDEDTGSESENGER